MIEHTHPDLSLEAQKMEKHVNISFIRETVKQKNLSSKRDVIYGEIIGVRKCDEKDPDISCEYIT